jgi:hypothetical protein
MIRQKASLLNVSKLEIGTRLSCFQETAPVRAFVDVWGTGGERDLTFGDPKPNRPIKKGVSRPLQASPVLKSEVLMADAPSNRQLPRSCAICKDSGPFGMSRCLVANTPPSYDPVPAQRFGGPLHPERGEILSSRLAESNLAAGQV